MADEKVEKTAAVLPLSVSEKMTKKARGAAPPLPGVRDLILWTLLHACIVAFSCAISIAVSFAFSSAYTLIICQPQKPSWPVTDDGEVDMAAFAAGLLWGGLWSLVSHAAAGALARMLPRLRRRLHLLKAYTALVAGCAMWAGLHQMFVAADPGCLSYMYSTGLTTVLVVIFILGVVVLGLIVRRGEEEEEEEKGR